MSKRPADAIAEGPATKKARTDAALRVVVGREMSLRQALIPRRVGGRELVVLALAACDPAAKLRALGLQGDLAPLLLRWGHCAKFIQKSLTCCPERREILATCDPAVIAAHMDAAPGGSTQRSVGMPPLLDVLLSGRLISRVSAEWLVARMPSDYWLAFAMDRAGHMSGASPDWIMRHLRTDASRVLALRTGGFLRDRRVSSEWLVRAIASPAKLIGCLADLGQPCSRDFIASAFRRFSDYMQCFMTWHAPWASHAQLIQDFNRWYRNADEAPEDLARELTKLNYTRAGVATVPVLDVLTSLRGVPGPMVVEVVITCDELVGLRDWVVDLSDCVRELRALGWSDEDAGDIADVIIFHEGAHA